MINDVGQAGNLKFISTEQPRRVKQKEEEPVNENYLDDCYKKQSEKDVPMMKGNCGPRLKTTYMRWDEDLQIKDKREAGSLPLLKRNTSAKTLAKKYREFAKFNFDVTLGEIRHFYGTIGIAAIRKEIKEQGIPKEFKA